ncbi:MAG: amidase family protein [Planctomycetota bacterium]
MKSNLDLPASLAELGPALRAGRITSVELVQAAVRRHEATGGSYGAYVNFDADRALDAARNADLAFQRGEDRGPLQGLPVSVKDLFGVEGYPTYAGSSRQLPVKWEREGPVVRQLHDQLAVIMGKTHTVEFAFGGLGTNPHWPTPHNPCDPSHPRVPGGSSSGAGVSLLAGSAVIALGTDTAGSVRIPASMTGNVGLKTTYGRWSTEGVVPLSPSLDSVGLLARTVDDLAAAFAGLDTEGTLPSPRPIAQLRFRVLEEVVWDSLSPGVASRVRAALDQLEAAGARVETVSFPHAEEAIDLLRTGGLAAPEFREFIHRELPEWQSEIDPFVWQRVEAAGDLSADAVAKRQAHVAELSASARQILEGWDGLLAPTVAITPPRLDEIDQLDAYRTANLLALRNTSLANFLGQCAVTLPVGNDEAGMPVGLQIMGPGRTDAALIAIAQSIAPIVSS